MGDIYIYYPTYHLRYVGAEKQYWRVKTLFL
jgi:hypothetical protein